MYVKRGKEVKQPFVQNCLGCFFLQVSRTRHFYCSLFPYLCILCLYQSEKILPSCSSFKQLKSEIHVQKVSGFRNSANLLEKAFQSSTSCTDMIPLQFYLRMLISPKPLVVEKKQVSKYGNTTCNGRNNHSKRRRTLMHSSTNPDAVGFCTKGIRTCTQYVDILFEINRDVMMLPPYRAKIYADEIYFLIPGKILERA